MSDELMDEVEVLNSIYGPDTLVRADEDDNDNDNVDAGNSECGKATTWILRLPGDASWLRLRFSARYPAEAPNVLSTQHSSGGVRGAGARDLGLLREAIKKVFRAGEVCVYDAVEHVRERLGEMEGQWEEQQDGSAGTGEEKRDKKRELDKDGREGDEEQDEEEEEEVVQWTVSEPIVENKSTFVARVAAVSSAAQARRCIGALTGSERRVRDATHNVAAWRVREGGVVAQDCDDDGETAAGARLLHLMHLMGVWDAVVVVSRWFGGVKLGPRRFALINTAARDAFVRAGLVEDNKKKAR